MEAFIWMFKNEEFKKHFWLLCIFLIIFVAIIAWAVGFKTIGLSIIMLFTIVFLACMPMGYFWELTGAIINRDFDVIASQVYDGKIKEVYNVHFPKFNILKFIWRGFASIVAMVILYLPFYGLNLIAVNNGTLFDIKIVISLLFILFLILLPALFWNYAKQNSVFSMLNIFKATFLVGNYTFKYFRAIFLLIIICLASYFVDSLLVPFSSMFEGTFVLQNSLISVGFIIGSVFMVIKDVYLMYVAAYVLGTIVPTQEG